MTNKDILNKIRDSKVIDKAVRGAMADQRKVIGADAEVMYVDEMTNTLDEILFSLTDQSTWDLIGITQEQSDELVKLLTIDRVEAKQQILQWVADEVIGIDANEKTLGNLIKERITASNGTTSDDRVVQIAWLADGIDLWHKSNGQRGHSPVKARRFIISSMSRLLDEKSKDQREILKQHGWKGER